MIFQRLSTPKKIIKFTVDCIIFNWRPPESLLSNLFNVSARKLDNLKIDPIEKLKKAKLGYRETEIITNVSAQILLNWNKELFPLSTKEPMPKNLFLSAGFWWPNLCVVWIMLVGIFERKYLHIRFLHLIEFSFA